MRDPPHRQFRCHSGLVKPNSKATDCSIATPFMRTVQTSLRNLNEMAVLLSREEEEEESYVTYAPKEPAQLLEDQFIHSLKFYYSSSFELGYGFGIDGGDASYLLRFLRPPFPSQDFSGLAYGSVNYCERREA